MSPKRILAVTVLAGAAALVAPAAAMAAPGGTPAVHGVSGAEWGAAVSGLAQSAPGALADHIQAAKGR
jgi:hypothetical protein